MKAQPLVACPTCGAPTPFAPANRWRPFCSERCRSIDLGGWASESYRIPVTGADAEDAEGPEGDGEGKGR